MENTAPQLGFGHFLAQADAVGLALFVVLLALSVASWTVIFGKLLRRRRALAAEAAFVARFESAANSNDGLLQLAKETQDTTAHGAILAAALEAERFAQQAEAAGKLAHVESASELVSRSIQRALDDAQSDQEVGQTLLASTASSAPFIGLFGTVWGIYHALLAIGASGESSLDQVAGPVGEALIMTALGLAVAIPAALAYNAFARQTRLLIGRLEQFAHLVFVRVSTGSIPAGRL